MVDVEGVLRSVREAWHMANKVYDSPSATPREKDLALALATLSYAVVKSHGGDSRLQFSNRFMQFQQFSALGRFGSPFGVFAVLQEFLGE